MIKFVLCIGFLLVGNSPAADPAPPTKPAKPKLTPEAWFKRLDKDNNGTLNLDEFTGFFKNKSDEAKIRLAFRKRDKDANGKLTLEEFASGFPKEDPAPEPAPAPEPGPTEKGR
jgi:hypothetical protein